MALPDPSSHAFQFRTTNEDIFILVLFLVLLLFVTAFIKKKLAWPFSKSLWIPGIFFILWALSLWERRTGEEGSRITLSFSDLYHSLFTPIKDLLVIILAVIIADAIIKNGNQD